MTKQETRAYYDALGNKNRTIFIDTTDEPTEITERIQNTINNAITILKNKSNEFINIINDTVTVFFIEVFHNDVSTNSYKLKITKKDNDEYRYDLFDAIKLLLEDETMENIVSEIIKNMPQIARSPYTKYIDALIDSKTCRVKSFKDLSYQEDLSTSEIIEYTKANPENNRILGVFYINNEYEFHPINHADLDDFDEILNYIQDEAIRLFASVCLRIIPDYVMTTPASYDSTKRQASDLCEGGLKRHLIHTAMVVHMLTELPYARIKFSDIEIDMMLVAALFHDFLKRGWTDEYNDIFEHPRLAANAIRNITGIIPVGNITFISNCIESHMGSRNIDPDGIAKPLPTPDTDAKYVLTLADHFATRKELAFINDNTIYAYSNQNICTVKNIIPLSDNQLIMIDNAIMLDTIDKNIAQALNINKTDNEIKVIWSHMIKNKTATIKQQKYIELAQKLLFT